MSIANSLSARILGVVRSPRSTFERLATEPRWADVLVVTLLVTALSSAFLLETETGRLALLDQWERTALAFGRTVGDSEYAALAQATTNGAAYAIASSFASGPLLAVALSAALLGAFRLAGSRGATFRQVLAIVVHAGVILMVRQVVATPVVYARETLASPMTLSLFFTMLDETSPLARFFGIVDLFVMWWIVVLALGMSVLYRKPARRLALAFMGTYVALAGVLTMAMALTGGTA
ncbi:MAG TPA: YIP1 family protein [Vicinamibacterales bacterium]